MGARVDLNVSLDGYATTEGGTPDNPFGEDWNKLTAAYAATRTVRERVFHDTSGEGTTGVDDKYAADRRSDASGLGRFVATASRCLARSVATVP